MSYYYDRHGEPMTLENWAQTFESTQDRIIARDRIEDVEVSTVWVGLDHSFGDGPPLIFETMVFGGDHDGHQWHYSTEDDARAGHERACALVSGQS